MKRIEQIRRDTDTTTNISITLQDINVAVVNHIKNVINPTIKENDNIIKVPVYFATPERWKTVQADGYFRDEKTKQMLVPVMTIARNSIDKNTSMPVDKLDGKLRKTVKKGWNKKDRYDIFSVRNKLRPTPVYYSVTMPDYVNIAFEITIWTMSMSQMEAILEKFIYAEASYWGDKYYKFRVNYDSIGTLVEMGEDKNRVVRATINITTSAYIIPEEFANKNTTIKIFEPAKLVVSIKEITHSSNIFEKQRSIPVSFEEGTVINNENLHYSQFATVDDLDFVDSNEENIYVLI